ncbi:MAG: tetratricopeptide repeat protein [Acidobacteria bacterium]|nr:tetratricopeptide repeat protein [Acidobacteriota bacterium]
MNMNFCQKCHWNNEDLGVHCARCGATLLPPLIPQPSLEAMEDFQDEDKFEILNLLDSVRRFSERRLDGVDLSLELQSQFNLRVSVVLERLLKTLEENGTIDRKHFHREVEEEVGLKRFSLEQKALLERRREAVLTHCNGKDAGAFAALVEFAWPLLYTSRHREAVEGLHRALEMDPVNPVLLRTLAEILFIGGDLAGAEKLNRRLLERFPDRPGGNMLSAMIQLKRGNAAAAIERLRAAREASPRSFTLHFLAGTAHFLKHEFEKAGESFREACRSRPLPVVPPLSAMAFYLGNKVADAETLLEENSALTDETGFAPFLQGLIRLRRNQPRKADEHFRRATAANRKWRKVISRLATPGPDHTEPAQIRYFTGLLRRRMEEIMALLISEIQNFNG